MRRNLREKMAYNDFESSPHQSIEKARPEKSSLSMHLRSSVHPRPQVHSSSSQYSSDYYENISPEMEGSGKGLTTYTPKHFKDCQ